MHHDDASLVEVFLEPIRKCSTYRPAFGLSGKRKMDLASFRSLYGADPFYAWLGLDDPLVYSAHRAAGGLTSVYRQVGVGAERLFREVVKSSLGLTSDQVSWSYEYRKTRTKTGRRALDAKIDASDLNAKAREPFSQWLKDVRVRINRWAKGAQITGAVFEVRQGYKSADSKRQLADMYFGDQALHEGLAPVFPILSTQVSEPVIQRYRSGGMLVLTGTLEDDPVSSTFAFVHQVVGYDLVGFFNRNSRVLRAEVTKTIAKLLAPD